MIAVSSVHLQQRQVRQTTLTCEQLGWFFNFGAWVMKKLLGKKKVKLLNKRLLVENKTEITQHVLKMQEIFFLSKYVI